MQTNHVSETKRLLERSMPVREGAGGYRSRSTNANAGDPVSVADSADSRQYYTLTVPPCVAREARYHLLPRVAPNWRLHTAACRNGGEFGAWVNICFRISAA